MKLSEIVLLVEAFIIQNIVTDNASFQTETEVELFLPKSTISSIHYIMVLEQHLLAIKVNQF